jgi:hypothetical protein
MATVELFPMDIYNQKTIQQGHPPGSRAALLSTQPVVRLAKAAVDGVVHASPVTHAVADQPGGDACDGRSHPSRRRWTALARMAAEAALKGAVREAVKEAYHALKEKVSSWASNDVTALEESPTSATRQALIAEIVNARPKEDQDSVRLLAEVLVAALKKRKPATGLDIGRFTALEVDLGNITVTEGVGARIEDACVSGLFDSTSPRVRMPPPPSRPLTIGWRITTPRIPIPGSATDRPGSTSFPKPLRVRFNGVNSTDVTPLHR